MSTTDRIEKSTLIRAPRARVWRALSDAKEFGEWFGAVLEGPFAPGAVVRGRIADPAYAHVQLEMIIERIEPEQRLAYRWHPYAVEPGVDYSAEPTTLVEITLADAPEGTLLTVVESGFDAIPHARRDEAFRMNAGGWAAQVENVRSHVESAR